MADTTDLDIALSMARLWGPQAPERAAFYRAQVHVSLSRWDRIAHLIETAAVQTRAERTSRVALDDGRA